MCLLFRTINAPPFGNFRILENICKMMTRIFILIALSISLSSAFAERTCRILFLGAPNGAPSSMHLFDGTKSQEVVLPRRNLSPVYKVPAGPLKLQLLPEPFQSAELLPPGAPSAIVPESINDFYLLLSSDPDNQVAPVKMKVVAANSKGLRAGEMLWFNLTQDRIAGRLGKQKLALNPGDIKRIMAPMRGKGAYPIDLYYKRNGSDHIHPICQSKWRYDPNSRSLVFVMKEANRAAPVVYSFRDSRRGKIKSSE